MFRTPLRFIVLFMLIAALSGCKGRGLNGGGSGSGSTPTNTGSGAPVVLALTDAPPANTSILSAEVTLTGAMLTPGNVSLLPTPQQVELTKLLTDIVYLTTTNVNPGNYTSLVLTFANPSVTFENDGAAIAAGGGNPACAAGAVCTFQPVAANLSTTLPLSSFTLTAGSATGLLVDVQLTNLLSTTLGVDFQAGTTVSQFTPAGSNAPPVGAEDVLGQVTSVDTAASSFTLQNALTEYTLTANSATTYFQLPSTCTTASFACVQSGQILSVDIGIQSNGSVVARNVVFEDASATDTEVEGVITSINATAQTFNMVALDESATVSGLSIGQVATVHYSTVPLTPLDVDFAHADNSPLDTTCCLFSLPTDLVTGQEVAIRRNPITSSASSITADRVLLRSSRFSGTIQSIPAPFIDLGGASPPFPSLFASYGITQIQAQTSTPTIYAGTSVSGIAVTNISQLAVGNVAAVRGPLFNVSGARTLVTSKVVVEP